MALRMPHVLRTLKSWLSNHRDYLPAPLCLRNVHTTAPMGTLYRGGNAHVLLHDNVHSQTGGCHSVCSQPATSSYHSICTSSGCPACRGALELPSCMPRCRNASYWRTRGGCVAQQHTVVGLRSDSSKMTRGSGRHTVLRLKCASPTLGGGKTRHTRFCR
jgi:hypothetical protein